EVEVLEVIHVIGRDRVRVRDVQAGSGAEAPGDPARGLAAALAAGRYRGRRIEAHDEIAAQRLEGLDVGRNTAARKGVAADVGVELGTPEQRRRRGRRQSLEPDFLRVVGGIEGQLVAGPGGSGPEQAE